MKPVKVSKDPSVKDNGGMAEIYQSQKTKQALLRRDGPNEFTRITNFVLCRDFLVDTYSFAKEKRDFGIYSFNFAGSTMQPDWTAPYILMKFDGAVSRENFMEHLPILQKIEKDNDFEPTAVREVEDEKNLLAVIGDVKWLQNCLKFSLYSLLLRVLCYKYDGTKDWIAEFGAMATSDSKYIASVPRKTLDRIFKDLSLIDTKTFCGFDPKSDGVGSIHHNSGFISVFGSHSEISQSTVRTNRHWKELTKAGLESHTK